MAAAPPPIAPSNEFLPEASGQLKRMGSVREESFPSVAQHRVTIVCHWLGLASHRRLHFRFGRSAQPLPLAHWDRPSALSCHPPGQNGGIRNRRRWLRPSGDLFLAASLKVMLRASSHLGIPVITLAQIRPQRIRLLSVTLSRGG